MLSDLLEAADWSSPPESMEFSMRYGDLLHRVAELSTALGPGQASAGVEGASSWELLHRKAVSLYLSAPGLVNVMLNYKICVEHGLPLHPTVYYELKEAAQYRMEHGLPAVDRANRLYRRSIDMARAALRLEPGFFSLAQAYRSELPPEILDFVYTGIRDPYTWRGSEPRLLEKLAQDLRAGYKPEIMIAAAHGSIMPALLLAEILDVPLYFIRFSMFKRNDEEPILTFSDKAWLYAYKDAKALLYDEDVAGGRTLTLFALRLGGLFKSFRTACSIRHAGSSIRPDFTAKTWWD